MDSDPTRYSLLTIRYSLLAPQRRQALRRIEIGEDGRAAGLDLGDVLGMANEQRARPLIAAERRELRQKTAGEQHRIAAPALMHRHADETPLRRIESCREAAQHPRP